ncbi:MAG: DUF1223 domain-containing protein [Xanthobacteraceae bacterium]
MASRQIKPLYAAAFALVSCAFGAASPAAATETRAVIELFTSQGCDSCPPADKLFGELSQQPDIIAMTLAVDYWDYLGWKDTLALAGHGNRQRAYARVRGDRDVFTPQVVVNGSAQALGSDKAQIEQAILKSRKSPATLAVPVSLSVDGGNLIVSVPGGEGAPERAEVWLCPIVSAVPVEITRGENKGKQITYHNVVRRWLKIGEWTGEAANWKVPLSDFQTNGVDQVAVVVQSGTAAAPNTMLAAAMIPLH